MRTSRGPGTCIKHSEGDFNEKPLCRDNTRSEKLFKSIKPVHLLHTVFKLDVNLWLPRFVNFFCSLHQPPPLLPFHALSQPIRTCAIPYLRCSGALLEQQRHLVLKISKTYVLSAQRNGGGTIKSKLFLYL